MERERAQHVFCCAILPSADRRAHRAHWGRKRTEREKEKEMEGAPRMKKGRRAGEKRYFEEQWDALSLLIALAKVHESCIRRRHRAKNGNGNEKIELEKKEHCCK